MAHVASTEDLLNRSAFALCPAGGARLLREFTPAARCEFDGIARIATKAGIATTWGAFEMAPEMPDTEAKAHWLD